MKNWWHALTWVSLALLLMMGFGVPIQGYGEEILKIGIIAPLSGPGLSWGENYILLPAEVLADEVNAQGGLKVGGKVYKIKLIPYDDKYTGEGGVAAATRLVYEDKVKFIFGPISSASLLAIQPITEKAEVIVMGDTYTTKALGPDKPFTFRITVPSDIFSDPFISWVHKKYPQLKSVVIFAPNDETGRETGGPNEKGYKKVGINVLSTEYYQRAFPDMAPLITRMLPKKPDILETDGSAAGDAANIFKTARAMGYKGQFVRTGGESTDAIIAAAGEAAEGMIYVTMDVPVINAELANFMAKLKAKRPDRPATVGSASFYDAYKLFLKAVQNAGTVEDTRKIKREIEAIKKYKGILGSYTWTGKEAYGIDHQIFAPMYVGQVLGGQKKVVGQIVE